MIISHRHRFIFVKTFKTAGSSIEAMLARSCGPDDVITPIYPALEGHAPRNHRGGFVPFRAARSLAEARADLRDLRARRRFYNHIPARLARARLPSSVWRDYFVFCVDRNPWDKTLSHFHMFRNAEWHGLHDPDLTLERYMQNGVFCHNAQFYCDRGGEVIVDRVLRYDRLETELGEVLDRLGLPFEGLPRAKAGLRPEGSGYREALSRPQADRLAELFRSEIDMHGWTY